MKITIGYRLYYHTDGSYISQNRPIDVCITEQAIINTFIQNAKFKKKCKKA